MKLADKQTIWMFVLTGFLLIPVVFISMDVLKHINTDPVETAYISKDCDLHTSSCEALFKDGGKLIFSIKPTPVAPLLPLELRAELVSMDAESVRVDFQGVGVEMGFYRPQLTDQGNNVYTGTASLAVCTLDKMLWQSTVIIKSDKGTVVAPFQFEVEQP